MKIVFIGKFEKIHDEEYIARSFEYLGHTVIRVSQDEPEMYIHKTIVQHQPDVLLFTKWNWGLFGDDAIKRGKEWGMKTVCWLFDLYWNYPREWQIKKKKFFKADYVFTTDGGNEAKWKEAGVNHFCVRQGIFRQECQLRPGEPEFDVIFVGSDNPYYQDRTKMVRRISEFYSFRWFGRKNTDELRGMPLNKRFGKSKIVLGDSVYSPYYWSNRVVETLGRGGFLIHRDVPGIKDEYPDLVTYNGTFEDLKSKIDYYLEHEEERLEIVKKNWEFVKDNYTMDKKCKELLNYIS